MSEVAVNEEVTAEVLNNIGVDLGLTEFSYFVNNTPYAVHQLNQITSDLVSAGVLRTGTDGKMGCEVIVSDGVAYVQPGVIVFASGAKIRITQPVGVDLVAGTYIYAIADSTIGTAKLEVSDTEPTGDYVMLAVVDAEGVLADRRSSCVAKVMIPADAQNVYREFTVEVPKNSSTELNVGVNGFLYVSIVSGALTGYNSLVASGNNVTKVEDGSTASMHLGRQEWDALISFSVKREGQILTFKNIHATDITINLIVM